MSTLRGLIDNRIQGLSICLQYLNNIADEDLLNVDYLQELKLINLLKDEKFIEIIEKYFSEVSKAELSDFLCECVQKGYSIADSKYVLNYLIYDEIYDEREYTLPIIDATRTVIENSDNIDTVVDANENSVEVNCYDKEQYYFKINYLTMEEVCNEPQQRIVFDSNLIDTAKFAVDLLSEISICQLENCQGEIKVYLTGIDSFSELNIHSFDIEKFALSFDRNTADIIGDATSVEDCFLIFKGVVNDIYEIVDGANILNRLKATIQRFENKFKQISLRKLQLSPQILAKLNNCQLLKIKDLLDINIKEFDKDTLSELLSAIDDLDSTMPDELVAKMMHKLKPAHERIVKMRYFDDKILTLEEVGNFYNVTRERIRQLEKKSIDIFNSPKNQLLRKRIINQMQLLSTYDCFITVEDLQKSGINKGVAILLSKCLDDIVYEQEWDLFFFNNSVLRKFESVLTEIPTEFTTNELSFYAEYIADSLNSSMNNEDVCYLIEKKYKKYGDFYVTGRLNQKTILSYIMTQYFPNGIDLYDDDNINLVREKARIHFDGYELAENNRAIISRLQDFCVPIGRGTWKFDIDRPLINGDFLHRIISYIKNYGSPVVPASSVFAAFQDELSSLDITNKYHLQGQLKRVLPTAFKTNRDYIYSGSSESFYRIVEEYIKQSNTIVTRSDILKQFPGITDIVIQQVTSNTKVVNMYGYYVHLDNLNITKEERALFKNHVDSCIVDDSIYHGKTIYQAIKNGMSGLFSRIGVNHYLQCFYLLRDLFPNEYNYVRPFIAKKGVEIVNGEAQVLQRIQNMQEIKVSTVREIARNVGTVIDRYIEFADRNNDLILIKDRATFISADYLELDKSAFEDLDDVLTQFLNDDNYKSLSLFFDYWKLPKLKIKWTDWLLYSIINLFSNKFKTAVSSNFIAEAIPIVVKNEFNINDISADDFSKMEKMDVDYFADDDDLIDELDIEDLE